MPASHRPPQQAPSDDHGSSGQEAGGGDHGGSSRGSSRRDTSMLEWALAAVSALLVLGAIGVLLHEALGEPSTPPLVVVTVEAVRPVGETSGAGYLVEFRAENRGQTTAARVHVEGTLRRGAETVETASTTLDYVPAEARRQGGLYFTEDPRAYELEVRPTGYDLP